VRPPALAWFCGGALFAATLGAPLAGVFGALFWTRQDRVSDALADDTLAVRRVVLGLSEGWGIPDFAEATGPAPQIWRRPQTGDERECDGQIRAEHFGGVDKAARDFRRIYGAVVHEEQRNARHDADLMAQESFCHLPAIALGGLAQCMHHSLLSGACTFWARHRLAQDKDAQAKAGAKLLESARSGDDRACLLLDWAKQSSGGQTLIGKIK
jgi:hypothetical protein